MVILLGNRLGDPRERQVSDRKSSKNESIEFCRYVEWQIGMIVILQGRPRRIEDTMSDSGICGHGV